jgi:hypothetical protein
MVCLIVETTTGETIEAETYLKALEKLLIQLGFKVGVVSESER